MAKTYEELLAGATQIKNNELPESNTHSLVGGQLVDMVEKNKDDKDKSDKKFTELENEIAIKSNNYLSYERSKYIASDGTISSAVEQYRMITFFFEAGYYYIYSPGSSSSKTLCKYSDSTFNSFDREIIGKVSQNDRYFNKIYLESGYYAFCWAVDDDKRGCGFVVDESSFLAYLYNKNESDIEYLKSSIIPNNLFDITDIEVGKYITYEGSIINSVTKEYRCVKFELNKRDLLYIYNIGNDYPILYQYEDAECTTPTKDIIGNYSDNFSTFLYLDAGYYAFCWKEENNDTDSVEYCLRNAHIIASPNSKLIYELYINGLFKGINIKDLLIGYSISRSDGSIGKVSANSYKTIKMFLTAGKYSVISPGCSSQGHFWKYSDSTYSTPEKEIITEYGAISTVVELQDGYYAMCYNDGADSLNFNDVKANAASVTKYMDENKQTSLNGIDILNDTLYMGKSINPSTGLISDVLQSYKLAKAFLTKGTYLVKTTGSSSQHTMWKYSDSTYSTPEKEIIGRYYNDNGTIVIIEEGYYAICWNDLDENGYKDNAAFIVPVYSNTAYIVKSTGLNFNSFSDFDIINDSFTISDDSKEAVSVLTGSDNRIEYNTETFEDSFVLSSKVTPLSGDSSGFFEFCFGKWNGTSGTIFSMGKDSEGGYIAAYADSDLSQTFKYRITEFSVNIGESYYINLYKKTEQKSYYIITITNERGVLYSKTIYADYTGEEDTENEANGSDIGYAWGKVCYYSLVGSMRVSNVTYGYPVNYNHVKLVCVGHSFIEGNSIWSNKDKRFSALLCSDLGTNNTMILGQGGASTTTVMQHLEKELSWLSNANYVLFCIGTNDLDSTDNANRLGEIEMVAESYNIKTIWLTIPPRKDAGEDHPIMNNYIKEHFNYVDINPAFYTEEGSIDTSAYVDNVHPTVDTHKRIYEIIKAHCQYLYSL